MRPPQRRRRRPRSSASSASASQRSQPAYIIPLTLPKYAIDAAVAANRVDEHMRERNGDEDGDVVVTPQTASATANRTILVPETCDQSMSQSSRLSSDVHVPDTPIIIPTQQSSITNSIPLRFPLTQSAHSQTQSQTRSQPLIVQVLLRLPLREPAQPRIPRIAMRLPLTRAASRKKSTQLLRNVEKHVIIPETYESPLDLSFDELSEAKKSNDVIIPESCEQSSSWSQSIPETQDPHHPAASASKIFLSPSKSQRNIHDRRILIPETPDCTQTPCILPLDTRVSETPKTENNSSRYTQSPNCSAGNDVVVEAEEVNRIRKDLGLSPASSLRPGQTLTLDPDVVKQSKRILRQSAMFDASTNSTTAANARTNYANNTGVANTTYNANTNNNYSTGTTGTGTTATMNTRNTHSRSLCPMTPIKMPRTTGQGLRTPSSSVGDGLSVRKPLFGSESGYGNSDDENGLALGTPSPMETKKTLSDFGTGRTSVNKRPRSAPRVISPTVQQLNFELTPNKPPKPEDNTGKHAEKLNLPKRPFVPQKLDLKPGFVGTKRKLPVSERDEDSEISPPLKVRRKLDTSIQIPEPSVQLRLPFTALAEWSKQLFSSRGKVQPVHVRDIRKPVARKPVARKLLEENEDDETEENFIPSAGPASMNPRKDAGQVNTGFTTAKGRTVAVNRKLLDEINSDRKEHVKPPAYMGNITTGFMTAKGNSVPVDEQLALVRGQKSRVDGNVFLATKPGRRPRESIESMVVKPGRENRILNHSPRHDFPSEVVTPMQVELSNFKNQEVPHPLRQPVFTSARKANPQAHQQFSIPPDPGGTTAPTSNAKPPGPSGGFSTAHGKPLELPGFATAKGKTVPVADPPAGCTTPDLEAIFKNAQNINKGFRQPAFSTGSGRSLRRKSADPRNLDAIFANANNLDLKNPNADGRRPLFSSGNGRPIRRNSTDTPALDAILKNARKLNNFRQPLFSTGNGKPVRRKSLETPQGQPPAFSSANGRELARLNAVPFSLAPGLASAHGRPVARVLPFTSASTARAGGHVAVGNLLQTPNLKTFETRKKTTATTNRTSRTNTPRSAVPTPIARSGGIKSTPFKRPRRVVPFQNETQKGEQIKPTHDLDAFFPKDAVPALSTKGRLVADGNKVAPRANSDALPQVSIADPAQGMHYVFLAERFGEVHMLPAEMRKYFKFEDISAFQVDDCVAMLAHVFPTAKSKAATRIGSEDWTRMAYGLAVWKLSKLGGEFFTVANLLRELWKRVNREWHKNQAPHLTQMLRRDASPRAHAVLMVCHIEDLGDRILKVHVTDGWYICRLKPDELLTKRIRAKKLLIGDKVHIFESELVTIPSERFFFGDADEMGAHALAPSANCVKKVRDSHLQSSRLGIRKGPLYTKKSSGFHPNGGKVPGALAVIVRAYPVFFIETNSEDGVPPIYRRREVEERTQAKFEEERASKMAAARTAVIEGNGKTDRTDAAEEIESRSVTSAIEVKIRGIADEKALKELTVRIYRPNEDVVRILGKEGNVVQMPAMRKTSRNWTAVSAAVRPVKSNTSTLQVRTQRAASTSQDLLTSDAETPYDFDGVFAVVHVTDVSSSGYRHAYLTDSDGSDGRFVVLELRGTDAEQLPRAMRARKAKGDRSRPVVVLRDVLMEGVDASLGFIHASVTLRSNILSGASVRRRGSDWAYLLPELDSLEAMVRTKGEQLNILGEAVAAFACGARSTIRAYFSSTQSQS